MRVRFLRRWLLFGSMSACFHFFLTVTAFVVDDAVLPSLLFPFAKEFVEAWSVFAANAVFATMPIAIGNVLMIVGPASALFANSALVAFTVVGLVLFWRSRKVGRAMIGSDSPPL